MFSKKEQTDNSPEDENIEQVFDVLKPKFWKLFNWLIFCSFILILSSYLNALIFLVAFSTMILIILAIKLYLLNKLPPTNFRIYIFTFILIFIICEYHHLQIVYFRSLRISHLDYHQLLTDPGIFIAGLCNIVFTTKIQVAPDLFFKEDFIQWFAIYSHLTPSKALMKLDGIFLAIFGYIVPVLINFIYAMLIGVGIVRIKQFILRG